MYDFTPMMPFYTKFSGAPTTWIQSKDGRKMIAKTIRFCRNKYGAKEGKRFYNALTLSGCVYPTLHSSI